MSLCYHQVRGGLRLAARRAGPTTVGFAVVSLPQFTEWLNGSPLPSRPAALLTFDGCYSDQLENAVPVLDSPKLPAIFFPASTGLACALSDVAASRSHTP